MRQSHSEQERDYVNGRGKTTAKSDFLLTKSSFSACEEARRPVDAADSLAMEALQLFALGPEPAARSATRRRPVQELDESVAVRWAPGVVLTASSASSPTSIRAGPYPASSRTFWRRCLSL